MEKNMAKIAAECLDEHKAEDILTLDVSRLTPFADHYVIATCSNERALAASADPAPADIMIATDSVMVSKRFII